jgi:CheY-like chemotaxis protein
MVQMPMMNGYTATKKKRYGKLRIRGKKRSIIAITAGNEKREGKEISK